PDIQVCTHNGPGKDRCEVSHRRFRKRSGPRLAHGSGAAHQISHACASGICCRLPDGPAHEDVFPGWNRQRQRPKEGRHRVARCIAAQHGKRWRSASRRDPGRNEVMANAQSKPGAVVRVCLGNFLEMYDFMVFGYYAAAIGRAFFPAQSEYASLMLSFMTFGTGYLMRPLGAVVLGAYIDRHGRRKGLLLTLSLMAIGTLSIGMMPGYETIGLLAPLLVVAGRLVQGLSAGVEVGGVSVYLAEIATPGHKGFFVSWQSASQQVAVMFAAFLGLILSTALRPEEMSRWGWRVPLLIGSMLLPFLLLLRRSLTETAEFKAERHRPTASQMWRTIMVNWRLMILGTMLTMTTTVTFYLITAYMPTYGSSVLHLTPASSMLVTLLVGISNFCWLPVMGALSDRVGRRPLLLV